MNNFIKTYLLLLIFPAVSVSLKAQNSIKGIVLDEKQKPAISASVALLLPEDSALVKSALTGNDGNYLFSDIPSGKYVLSVSKIGYKTMYKKVSIDSALVSLDAIHLQTSAVELSEVVVTAQKPFLEQKPGKLVVNVESSATSAGSNALEVLKKVPGVIIRNDKISISGRSNVMIYIDGRSSQYTDISQVLKDVSAANISKIEVITNPGAKYDAAGGSVINIILKRNAKSGTNGSVSLSGGIGLYDKQKEGFDRNFYRVSPTINLNHRKGKINLYGNYSFNHRNWFEYNEFVRVIQSERYFQTNLFYYNMNSHVYRTGIDYYADKHNTFGFLLSGYQRSGGSDMTNHTEQSLESTGQLLNSFETINDITLKRHNYTANLNWKHVFDSSGRQLNIDADYSTFLLNNSSDITNNASSPDKKVSNQRVNNPVRLIVVKADYSQPISKTATLETGLKISYANIDNYLRFTQNGVLNTDRNDEFLYNENINAAYVNYIQKYKSWQFSGGLRAEQTIATGSSEAKEVLSRNYWQLFPSFLVSKKVNAHFAAVVQYSRRIDRPSYQQQNPFILFLDSLTYTKGNPLLKPQLTNAYKFSLTYDNLPLFSVSYNKTKDVIFDNAPKQEGNQTYTTPENLARFKNIVFELNFPIQIGKKINGYCGNQAILNHYTADYLGSKYDGKRWNWLAYWQVAYTPVTSWSIEVSGYFTTKFLTEFFTIEKQGSLGIAIQKTVWEKKGKFTLNFNDVFFSEKTKGRILYQDINVKFRQWEESRNVRLAFTYSFGNKNLNAVRARKTAADEETKRIKTK